MSEKVLQLRRPLIASGVIIWLAYIFAKEGVMIGIITVFLIVLFTSIVNSKA